MHKNKYLLILLAILAIAFAISCAKTGRDFEVFVDAGGKIINGQNIYKPPFAQNLQYYYSPLFALLLSPLAGLPIVLSQAFWGILSCFLLYRIWILSTEYFDLPQLSSKQRVWWIAVSLVLTARFIRYDMTAVQMTIFLLWATLQSLKWFWNDKPLAGAALLAFAINIKLLPLPFVFYLLYRKKIKGAMLTCLCYVLYLYLPVLYLGWDSNNFLLAEWFTLINPLQKNWTIEAESGPSSLVAMIPVYLTDTVGVLPVKRNFINLSYNIVFIIVNAVRLIFVILTLVFLRSKPFTSTHSKLSQYWEMSYLFIAIPLLFPHQQRYAFIYAAPALIYLAWYFVFNWQAIKQKMNLFTWTGLFIVGINFTPLIGRDIVTSYVYELMLHFRVLTFAAIALIVALWLCRPEKTLNKVQSPTV
ncbi:DUF2029 domain-containing protein [Mucilaginibacter limnophilus]|uniref:DUF2029 domain-containing protein n=1 Tax=Mucilaginibacter limnophilus TaxID=1932778 RepID=A0A3S2Y196_9SPHI|nr:glycosyltransferase 87 family protein [Mucilaginibacter limnophilus]RVT98186.1 DUF2029 domain-containing protein [Mucilaginibacter limnophilus]